MSQAFQPKPVHLRLLAAFEAAMQEGVNPSDTVIAKKLGVRRETVNRWRRRGVELWRWVYDHIGQRALQLKPIVDRRVTELAISGSAEHTKLYYQFVGKMEAPPADAPSSDGRYVVNLNLLVPRPEYPQPCHAGAVSETTAVPSVPSVNVR